MRSLMSRSFILLLALLTMFMFMAVSAGEAEAGKWKRRSKQHEEACKAWCAEHPDVCIHCSTKRGCGKGYDAIQSWTGYGKNWHACQKRLSRKEASHNNLELCRQWCGLNEGCEYCTNNTFGCGVGFETMQAWRGRGDNYVACGKKNYRNPATNQNRDDCHKWCQDNWPICRRCSEQKVCGSGYVAIKSWKGRGLNFHACAKREDVKEKNRSDCQEYCQEHQSVCIECRTGKGCGLNQTAMKTFNLGDSRQLDYHACKRKP